MYYGSVPFVVTTITWHFAKFAFSQRLQPTVAGQPFYPGLISVRSDSRFTAAMMHGGCLQRVLTANLPLCPFTEVACCNCRFHTKHTMCKVAVLCCYELRQVLCPSRLLLLLPVALLLLNQEQPGNANSAAKQLLHTHTERDTWSLAEDVLLFASTRAAFCWCVIMLTWQQLQPPSPC